jgi:hypothetical protein
MGKIVKHQVEKPIIFEFLKVPQGMRKLATDAGAKRFWRVGSLH